MALDHEAIYKAYAGTVVTIDDSAGAFDKDGNSVTLEQSNSQYGVQSAAWQFLDTHGANGSTAVVYKIMFASVYYGYTSYINRPHNADNNAYNMFGSSTITIQEVAT